MEKKTLSFGSALIAVVLSLGTIIVGKLLWSLDTTIVLLLSATVVSIFVVLQGVKWSDIEAEISGGIKGMGVPIVVLIETGILVGVWMASGTIPMMMDLGLKLISPNIFLLVTCLICTVMSVVSGTSWGTLATAGVALLSVGIGLGIPIPMTCGAIVVGSFFGDKMSPLSDSTIVAAASCEVPLVEHIRHMLWTTTPAYLVCLVLYTVLGFQFHGSIGGEEYAALLAGLESTFQFNFLLLLPPVIVFALVLTKKPALPAFAAGIFSAVVLGMMFQGQSFQELCVVMAKGCAIDSGSPLVNTLIQRGGMSSMLSTVAIVIGAAVFAAPVRASGAAQVLFAKVEAVAKTPGRFAAACYIIHPIFQLVAVTYYVTYPVMGSFCAPVYDKYGLSRANLTRTFEDSGTIIAPLIPWGMAGSYITAQLGVVPSDYWQYMPLCYLCIVFGIICSLTGIGVKRADGAYVRPVLWQKKQRQAA